MGKKTKHTMPNSCESAQFRRRRKPSKESSQTGGTVSSGVSRNTDELVRLLLDCVEQIPALTDQLAQNILGHEATEKKSEEIKNIDLENCSENCIQNTSIQQNKNTKHVEIQNSVQVNEEPSKDDKAVEAQNRSVDTMKCALKLVEACCDQCAIDNYLQIPQEVKEEVKAATERLQKLLSEMSAEAMKGITDCLKQAIASASEYVAITCDSPECRFKNGDLEGNSCEKNQPSPSESSPEKDQIDDKEHASSDKRKGGVRVTISVLSATEIQIEETGEPTDQPSQREDNDVNNKVSTSEENSSKTSFKKKKPKDKLNDPKTDKSRNEKDNDTNNKSQQSLTSKQNSSKCFLKRKKSNDKLDGSRNNNSNSKHINAANNESQHSLTSEQNSSKKSLKKNKSKDILDDSRKEKSSKKDKSGKEGTKKESQVSMVFDKEQNASITPKEGVSEEKINGEKHDDKPNKSLKPSKSVDETSDEHKPSKQSKEEQKRSSTQEMTLQRKVSEKSFIGSKSKLDDSKHETSRTDHRTKNSKSPDNDLDNLHGENIQKEGTSVKLKDEKTKKKLKEDKSHNNLQKESESSVTSDESEKSETSNLEKSDENKGHCCQVSPQCMSKSAHDEPENRDGEKITKKSIDETSDENKSRKQSKEGQKRSSTQDIDPQKETVSERSIKDSKDENNKTSNSQKKSKMPENHNEEKVKKKQKSVKVKDEKTKTNLKEVKSNNNMKNESKSSVISDESKKSGTSNSRKNDVNEGHCCPVLPQGCKTSHDQSKCGTNPDQSDESNEKDLTSNQDIDANKSGKSSGSQEKSLSIKSKAHTGSKKEESADKPARKLSQESSVHIQSTSKTGTYDMYISRTAIIITSSVDLKEKHDDNSSSRRNSDESATVSGQPHQQDKKLPNKEESSSASENSAPKNKNNTNKQKSCESCSEFHPSRSSKAVTDLTNEQSSDTIKSSKSSNTTPSKNSKEQSKAEKKQNKESQSKNCRCYDEKQKSSKKTPSGHSYSSMASYTSTSCKKCCNRKLEKKKSKGSSSTLLSVPSKCSCTKKSSENTSNDRMNNRRGSASNNPAQESESSICFCQQNRELGTNGGNAYHFLSELIRRIEDFLHERCFRMFFGPSLDETAIAFYETYPILPTAASNARNMLRSMFSDEEES